MTRTKEDFVPLTPGEVKMYCCGPTVYGLLHVGNFRGPVVYNLLRNWLNYRGYNVNYVYNFTDVDDKIIDRAHEEKRTPQEVSEHYIAEFWKDFHALKLTSHTHNPKVTEHMGTIQEFIQKLIDKGVAYETQGDVLYSVRSFAEYGKLSGRKIEDLQSGYRIDVDEKKRDPLDFALWKGAKEGEVSWPSPWGNGRPGWHIECSAMSYALLGEQIDIHGGGMDLYFPHHENEIAQSEACHGHRYVKYWVHNNMFNFGGAKMSKSLGNVRTMRSFLELYPAEIYKFLTLSVHHRSEADFSEDTIQTATKGLAKFYSALRLAESYVTITSEQNTFTSQSLGASFENLWGQIAAALDDDLNTPIMMAQLHEATKMFNSRVRVGMKSTPEIQAMAQDFITLLKRISNLTALFCEPAAEFLTHLDSILLEKLGHDKHKIQQMVDQRWVAKSSKDFSKADELRKSLTEMGIAVQDYADRSEWEVAK